MKLFKLVFMAVIVIFVVGCGLERWEREPRDSGGEGSDEVSSEISDVASSSSNDTGDGLDSTSSESGSTASYPNTPTKEEGGGVSESEPVVEFDWQRVLITEVVTDPQQDHGESTQENGILFDAFPGLGTVGSSDEYIEIYNGTSEPVDMSLWSLNMKDGTDESQDLADEDWETNFSLDGKLESVGAGEFLVLGNPAGAMNNSITLELLNGTSEIVDSVAVENGNASDLNDEAYYRSPTGEWTQGWATPGYFLE